MIPTPNPITTEGEFSSAWISHLRISIGVGGSVAHFPFNGTHMLAQDPKIKHFIQPLTEIDSIISAEALRLTGKNDLVLVSVFSPSPSKPVRIRFVFSDKSNFDIPDAYDFAGHDPVFYEAFNKVMTLIGEIL